MPRMKNNCTFRSITWLSRVQNQIRRPTLSGCQPAGAHAVAAQIPMPRRQGGDRALAEGAHPSQTWLMAVMPFRPHIRLLVFHRNTGGVAGHPAGSCQNSHILVLRPLGWKPPQTTLARLPGTNPANVLETR